MNKPKRVWSKKSPVFYKWKCVWKLWDKLWVYDPQFTEVESGQIYPNNKWENLSSTDELEIYDSNKATDIWTFKDWLIASYEFDDYDWTKISEGTVRDWLIPTAPTDPTRAWYTFTWWNPAVWPITEDTTYVAQYTINVAYTFQDYDETVISSGTVMSWTAPTAPADPTREWYTFTWWDPEVWAITEDTTYTATYEENVEPDPEPAENP